MAIVRIAEDDTSMRIADVWERERLDRADAEVLLSYLLARDRTWVIAHADDAVPLSMLPRLRDYVVRRQRGEPIASIVGQRAFFGRTFCVDRSVLVPRPETEGLVEVALDVIDGKLSREFVRSLGNRIVAYGERWGQGHIDCVADVGTGSGCIAVTLAMERPLLSVIATDVSSAALAVAERNADRHHVLNRIRFLKGAFLEPLEGITTPFLLVSNPPYVPDGSSVSPDVFFEPSDAVFAGQEGLDVLLPLLAQARAHPACTGFLFECREDQVQVLQRAVSFSLPAYVDNFLKADS